MQRFSDYLILREQESSPEQNLGRKGWKASRKQTMKYWRTLPTNLPINLAPIPDNHKGSLYDQDGIRITGSARFITAILSRLKELLTYETPTTKLDIEYGETAKSTKLPVGSPNASYAFYLYSRNKKRLIP